MAIHSLLDNYSSFSWNEKDGKCRALPGSANPRLAPSEGLGRSQLIHGDPFGGSDFQGSFDKRRTAPVPKWGYHWPDLGEVDTEAEVFRNLMASLFCPHFHPTNPPGPWCWKLQLCHEAQSGPGFSRTLCQQINSASAKRLSSLQNGPPLLGRLVIKQSWKTPGR